jgi:hypothetical protein
MVPRCSFCGSTGGPFAEVVGMFTVLMCADCQAARGHSSGPYPVMTRAQLRRPGCAAHLGAGIEGGPHRQLIAVMRQRPAAGEQVARMYQGARPGLAGAASRRAETLVAERRVRSASETDQSACAVGHCCGEASAAKV